MGLPTSHCALCVEIKAVGSIQSVLNEPLTAKKIGFSPDSNSNFQDE